MSEEMSTMGGMWLVSTRNAHAALCSTLCRDFLVADVTRRGAPAPTTRVWQPSGRFECVHCYVCGDALVVPAAGDCRLHPSFCPPRRFALTRDAVRVALRLRQSFDGDLPPLWLELAEHEYALGVTDPVRIADRVAELLGR